MRSKVRSRPELVPLACAQLVSAGWTGYAIARVVADPSADADAAILWPATVLLGLTAVVQLWLARAIFVRGRRTIFVAVVVLAILTAPAFTPGTRPVALAVAGVIAALVAAAGGLAIARSQRGAPIEPRPG